MSFPGSIWAAAIQYRRNGHHYPWPASGRFDEHGPKILSLHEVAPPDISRDFRGSRQRSLSFGISAIVPEGESLFGADGPFEPRRPVGSSRRARPEPNRGASERLDDPLFSSDTTRVAEQCSPAYSYRTVALAERLSRRAERRLRNVHPTSIPGAEGPLGPGVSLPGGIGLVRTSGLGRLAGSQIRGSSSNPEGRHGTVSRRRSGFRWISSGGLSCGSGTSRPRRANPAWFCAGIRQ